MKKISLSIPKTKFTEIKNFNFINEPLTKEFSLFYSYFYGSNLIIVKDSLLSEIDKVFKGVNNERLITISDSFFSNFTVVSETLIKDRKNKYAFELWQRLIVWAEKWRKENDLEIHLGTPYYFIAVASLSQFDIDAGSIFMHLALKEDRKHHKKWFNLPANLFLSLNPRKDQYISHHTNYMLGFIRDRLDGKGNSKGRYKQHYYKKRSGSLKYSDFRRKFLGKRSEDYLEIKYFFVHSLLRLWRLRRIHKSNKGENTIAPLIYSQVISGLLLTLEVLLKKKYSNLPMLGNLFKKFFKDEGLGKPDLKQIETDRDRDFEKWIEDCIKQESMLGDFSLSYGLRNYTSHTIESQQVIWKKQTNIFQSVMNCIFRVLEVL